MTSSGQVNNILFSKLDNSCLRELPVDDEVGSRIREVSACFSRLNTTPIENPEIVALSDEALQLIGLNREVCASDQDFPALFSGSKTLVDREGNPMPCFAHCYCGHQFGTFAGQLGDGRAISIGEVVHQGQRWELQTKGSGLTPFSRTADGRAVLRSSIREFLCSEHMWALGIPTTRAATVIASKTTKVIRDKLYNGNPQEEKCAVVMRMAPSFLRFGTWEILKGEDPHSGRAGPYKGDKKEMCKTILNFIIKHHFPHVIQDNVPLGSDASYIEYYRLITAKSAYLVALWQCVGFCHGVLNTDNMSALGLTIDYGPFGFLDITDLDWICNHSDNGGRYSYRNQPTIVKWNLGKLAEMLELAVDGKILREILEKFDAMFEEYYLTKMRSKLGLLYTKEPEDKVLVENLLATMQATGSDFTSAFRSFARMHPSREDCIKLGAHFSLDTKFVADHVEYLTTNCIYDIEVIKAGSMPSMHPSQLARIIQIAQQNPDLLGLLGVSPMMLKVQLEKFEKLEQLETITPQQKLETDREKWRKWIESYLIRIQSDMKENSEDVALYWEKRKQTMNLNNPAVVLRNHLAEEVIREAEKGNYGPTQDLLGVLLNPYEEVSKEIKDQQLSCPFLPRAPKWATELCVSCSS